MLACCKKPTAEQGSEPIGAEDSDLRSLFRSMDKDGDGHLTRSEVAELLGRLNMDASDAIVESIFHLVSKDPGSQVIEFPEFSKWMGSHTSQDELAEIFKVIDTEGNGTISTKELSDMLDKLKIEYLGEDVKAAMKKADTDGDGVIALEEFVKAGGLWSQLKFELAAVRSLHVQAEFDKMAHEYDELIRIWVPWYNESLTATVRHLPPRPKAAILELGSGTGNLSAALAEKFPDGNLHLVDNSGEALAFCRNRFKDRKGVTFYQEDFGLMTLGQASFDYVASGITLHHLEEPARKELFRKIHGWLRPGGQLSYTDIFKGTNSAATARLYEEWKEASYALGATDEQWARFMDHDRRYDRPSPVPLVTEWLREIGFVDIDVTWRRSLWVNIVASKA